MPSLAREFLLFHVAEPQEHGRGFGAGGKALAVPAADKSVLGDQNPHDPSPLWGSIPPEVEMDLKRYNGVLRTYLQYYIDRISRGYGKFPANFY